MIYLATIIIALILVVLVFRNTILTKQEEEKKTAEIPPSVIYKEKPLLTPDWVKNATIYQVNIRQFSKEGTFNAFTEQLPRIADLGIDVIWLMPIYPLCETNRKTHEEAETESLGSHYAVYDFFSVNPRYGTPEDLRQLIKATHDLGMKLILDFVPNHTGWDSRWMLRHPDWFVKDATGKIVSPIKVDTGESWAWDDVAQLDHTQRKVRENLIQAHEFWMREFNVDGFREDVAGEVPTYFWSELRPRLEKIRPVFMLAEDEARGQEHFNICFDANYAWGTHHVMKQIFKGKKPASALYEWTEDIKARFGTRGWQLNFTQNHDENTWHGTEKELFAEGADGYTALCFVIEGSGMIYNGQEVSLDKRLWFFNKDEIDWSGESRATFFKTLVALKHRNKALWNGQFGGMVQKLDTNADENIYAFYRKNGESRFVGIFNMRAEKTDLILRGGGAVGSYENIIAQHPQAISEQTTMTLEPYAFLLLSNV